MPRFKLVITDFINDPLDHERRILGAVRYQANVAYLHTDTALLPRRPKVWSAWNYLAGKGAPDARPVSVSYLINRLQPLPFATPVPMLALTGAPRVTVKISFAS